MSSIGTRKSIKRKTSDFGGIGHTSTIKRQDRKTTPPLESPNPPEAALENDTHTDEEDFGSVSRAVSEVPTVNTDAPTEFVGEETEYDGEGNETVDANRASWPDHENETEEDNDLVLYAPQSYPTTTAATFENGIDEFSSKSEDYNDSDDELLSGRRTPRQADFQNDKDDSSDGDEKRSASELSADDDPSGDWHETPKKQVKKKKSLINFNTPKLIELRNQLGILPHQIDERMKNHGIYIDRKILHKSFVQQVFAKFKIELPETKTDVGSDPDSILVGDEEPDETTNHETLYPTTGLRGYIKALIEPTPEDDARREELLTDKGLILKCGSNGITYKTSYYTPSTVTESILAFLRN